MEKFRSLWQLITVAFETIPNKPTFHSRHAYLAALQKFEWKKVASLTQDGSRYSRYMSSLQDTWKKDKTGISFILNRKFPRDTRDMSMVTISLFIAAAVYSKGYRIFFLLQLCLSNLPGIWS